VTSDPNQEIGRKLAASEFPQFQMKVVVTHKSKWGGIYVTAWLVEANADVAVLQHSDGQVTFLGRIMENKLVDEDGTEIEVYEFLGESEKA
jgi:hypothetical protein